MNEWTVMWMGMGKLMLVLIASLMWSIGGRDGTSKGIRRYGSTGLLVFGTIVFSIFANTFNWWYLLAYPLFVGATSMGYGVNDEGKWKVWKKVGRRGLFSLCVVGAGLPFVVCNMGEGSGQVWALFGVQLVVGASCMITLGVLNPLKAAQEELVVAFALYMMVPFYV